MRALTGRLGRTWLERSDLLSLRALGALAGGELDPLVFLQAAEAVNLNRGVVHEDVGAAVIRGDETIALVGVEPLHGALRHVPSPTYCDSPGPTDEDPGSQQCRDRAAGG